MNYIARFRESDNQIQTVKKHLMGVKDLAETYGEKLDVKHLAGLAGMLHDLGKYTTEFRDYITEAFNNPDAPPKRGSVDHSTAGGKLLYEFYHKENDQDPYKWILAEVVGNAIISHHSYLQDFLNPKLESSYLIRVKDKELDNFELTKEVFFEQIISKIEFDNYVKKALKELEGFLAKDSLEYKEKNLMFLTKFIFSVLIDADRTNSRLFEENAPANLKNDHEHLFKTYYERLLNKINSFKSHKNANIPINLLRSEISEKCEQFADKPSGIYTLNIPTGGGKTLASLRYALKHAILYQKKRIIYVVPYTTIIEQNAETVRHILKDDPNILEHHSNVIEDFDEKEEESENALDLQQRYKLTKDNWDSPLIFTTMVQFLNVFFSNSNRNIRRLHSLIDAVIIFDEVQKVPTSCISLFNFILNFLKKYGHVSMVLCTATQPALDFVQHRLEINTDAEMTGNLEKVDQIFKRVEIVDKATNEIFNNDKLTQFLMAKMKEVQNILVVLNTKTVVKDLYERLSKSEDGFLIYHLSTSMCAAHRKSILDTVRQQLEEGNKVICISTQLIEAGVDISFECVIRSLAGLDSIAQAAGRCNRHGENDLRYVYVIDHEEENLDKLKEIRVGKQIAKKLLIDLVHNRASHGGDILSKQAMDRYFQEYYTEFSGDLNYFIPKLEKEMVDLLIASKGDSQRDDKSFYSAYLSKERKHLPLCLINSYKTAARYFRVIKDQTASVIVPYEKGEKIIAELNGEKTIQDLSRLLKEAQQYTINLYDHEQSILDKEDGLVSYLDGAVLALKDGFYNKDSGFSLEGDGALKCLIDL